MNRPVWTAALGLLLALTSCGGGAGGEDGGFPAGFDSRDDRAKVGYVMERATPDSVARFICLAALGHVPGVHIDSLALATNHAYAMYGNMRNDKDSAMVVFQVEYDEFSARLPLADRMRLYKMAGEMDMQGLGYGLGLDYVGRIRERSMTPDSVRAEIEAMRKACADDPKMFARFMTGFKTALRIDRGKDLPEGVYETFIDYE